MAANRKSWRARVHKLKPPDCSTHFTVKNQSTPPPSSSSTSQSDSPGYKKFHQREKLIQAKNRQEARARRREAQFDLDAEEPIPEAINTPKAKHNRRKQYPDYIEAAAAAVFSSSDSELIESCTESITSDDGPHDDNDQQQLERVKRYILRDRHEMFFRPKLKPLTKPTTSLWAAAAPSPPPSSLWATAAPTPPSSPSTIETSSWTPTTHNDSIEWNTPDIMGHHRQPQHHPTEDITFRL